MNAPTPPVEMVVPLQRVMAAHGVDASLWAIVDACGGDLSLEGFARCVNEQGLDANVTRLAPGDLAYLPVQTLIEFSDGAIATLVAHSPRSIEVEDNDGQRRRVEPEDDPEPVKALQIRAAAAQGDGFLARLGARLRAEPHITRAVVMAFALSVVLIGLGMAGPLLTRLAFGSALPDRAPSLLSLIAASVVVIGLQMAYVAWLRRSALLFLSSKLSEAATTDLVAHMVRLPLSALRRVEMGAVRQSVMSAAAAAEAIPKLAPQIVDGVLGLGFLALTFLFDPRSALVAGAAGLVIIAGGVLTGRRRRTLRRRLLERTHAQHQILYETFAGIETVKAENVEGRMLAKWLDRVLAEESTSLALRLQTSTFATVTAAGERIAFAAVLLFMARRCLNGDGSIADLVAAVQASASFMLAAVKFAELPAAHADFRTDVERVDDIVKRPLDHVDGARKPADTAAPALVLRDVWFRYEEDAPWVLRGLDLVVSPGEKLLLTWPSGAGKSTLLRILSGLVEPTRGDALVFGSEASRSRRMIAYVPQSATLLTGSVIENLRILSGNARGERILAAAETTGLLAMLSAWPMGLETVISAGVVNVSSGQRQLILFTAAVASEAPLVLLDEALAHMDLDMRSRLGGASFFRDRTVVAVVHDASAAETAQNRIVPLSTVTSPTALLKRTN